MKNGHRRPTRRWRKTAAPEHRSGIDPEPYTRPERTRAIHEADETLRIHLLRRYKVAGVCRSLKFHGGRQLPMTMQAYPYGLFLLQTFWKAIGITHQPLLFSRRHPHQQLQQITHHL